MKNCPRYRATEMDLAPIDLSIDVMLWLFLRAGVLSEGMSHPDVSPGSMKDCSLTRGIISSFDFVSRADSTLSMGHILHLKAASDES